MRIEPVHSRRDSSAKPRLLPGIDEELDSMLRHYADMAVRHPEVRQMLKGYLVAMRLLQSDPDPATATQTAPGGE